MKTRNSPAWLAPVAVLLSTAGLTLAPLAGVVSTAAADNQRGTTLSATNTATGGPTMIVYDWSITKSADPSQVMLRLGETQTVEYTVTATRSLVSQANQASVSGETCVQNGGGYATENLTIVAQVQFKNAGQQYRDIPGASQTTMPDQLLPGDSDCYPYTVSFSVPAEAVGYRVVSQVTITNHAGWLPGGQHCPGPDVCPFGPSPKVSFELQDSLSTMDATANVVDYFVCPRGFTCAVHDNGPWSLEDSTTFHYHVDLTNTHVPCNNRPMADNYVRLTENDSGDQHQAANWVHIYTGRC